MKYFFGFWGLIFMFGCENDKLLSNAGQSEMIVNGEIVLTNINSNYDRNEPGVFDISIYEIFECGICDVLKIHNIPLELNGNVEFEQYAINQNCGVSYDRIDYDVTLGNYVLIEDYAGNNLKITRLSENNRNVEGSYNFAFLRESLNIQDTTYINGSFEIKVRS